MPHAKCTVCNHPELDAFTVMRKAGVSVRALARRFGLSPAAVDRHNHEDDPKKARTNAQHIAHIDEEISKLKRAQNRAKKNRDASQVLAIAKELRNWFVLRQKAEVVEATTASTFDADTEIPLREAIGIAKSLIEAQLHDPDVQEWIRLLAERVSGTTSKLPDTHSETTEG